MHNTWERWDGDPSSDPFSSYPCFAVKTHWETRSCSRSPFITKLLSSPGLHSLVGFGNTYEILPPEEGKVKLPWNLSGLGFWHMPSGYCHQYCYAKGSHLMIPWEVLPPEKAFLSQHQDITSCQTTNMVFQESVTLLSLYLMIRISFMLVLGII